MKKIVFPRLLTVLLFCLISNIAISQRGSTEPLNSKKVITKKIMYDVPITNNHYTSESDWFWQNMTKNDLEQLRTTFFDDVKNGIIQAYVYDPIGDYESFERIPKGDANDYFEENCQVMSSWIETDEETGSRIMVYTPYPAQKIEILELRFLEEWYYEGDRFCKRVIAVAPIFVSNEGKNIFYWVNIEDIE